MDFRKCLDLIWDLVLKRFYSFFHWKFDCKYQMLCIKLAWIKFCMLFHLWNNLLSFISMEKQITFFLDCWFFLLAINATAFRLSIIGQIWSTLFVKDPQGMYLQFVRKLFMLKYEILNEFLVYIFKVQIFFSNYRTISATTTICSFNGEIRQRTSNTWRL